MSEEHARKTVTVDPHPHLGIPTASIHPCKHAVTMKSMIDHEKAEGRQLRPDQYFFYFLKFVQSAIPSIEIGSTSLSFYSLPLSFIRYTSSRN